MKISEVEPGMSNVDIKGEVKDVGQIKEVKTKYGNETKVANATLKDDSGTVKLTLWGDQTGKISSGDTVELIKGYAKEYQGETQVSVGKKGEMKVNPE